MLVFIGTGAILVHELHGSLGHLGISLSFGLIVMAVIYALGDVSGAHINPAVTLGFFAAGRFSGKQVLPYILVQCLGACAASLSLSWLFPLHQGNLGGTLPSGSLFQSLVLEVILSFILMFVILSITQPAAISYKAVVGLVVGTVIVFEALVGGPISGASMNPARSLGPALVSGRLEHIWLYILAPVSGALFAAGACFFLRFPEQ